MNKLLPDIISDRQITKDEALLLFELDIEDLFYAASKIRKNHKGNKVKICSIINAKSGQCEQDCKFCAQSAFNKTEAAVYPLIEPEKIALSADNALENAQCFGIVSSGNYLNEKEIDSLCKMFKNYKNVEKLSVSIGRLSDEILSKLKKAGIKKIHHNLETSENFFPNICSTHSYNERVDTIKRAKALGFKICAGGLFGIGESFRDRVELAFTLKELDVESVPMNFFISVKGTALEEIKALSAIEILKTISIFRLILQKQDIIICGGREVNLRDLQSMIFPAGANGTMSGGYLTTGGRDIETDLKMIEDLGLETTITNYE
ncbi:MAG: biotin synthase BioB [Endomicrobia bacterium]|nr:biotin synthase BioB [Endomicrobiia bacterium]MCL2506117.1 biotin synthase BioB [Endomicrobiia bacterium]